MKKSFVHSLVLGVALVAVPAAHSATIEPGAGKTEGTPTPGAKVAREDSKKVSKLLHKAHGLARELRRDAQEMEGFRLSPITWESHNSKITEIREHVNQFGVIVEKLQQQRPLASAWQVKAIDRVSLLARKLAYGVQNTIDQLDMERGIRFRLSDPGPQLSINAVLASSLFDTVDQYVDFSRAQQRMHELSTQLEIPVPPQG